MAAIESDFGHYFANSPQNYLVDFLRRRHGYVKGPVLPYFDAATGKLDGIDDFYVVQQPTSGDRLIFEIHAINDTGASNG